MTIVTDIRFLRCALLLDAATSGLAAVVLVPGGGLLAGPLGLPEALLRGTGLLLVPFAAGVAWTARHGNPPVRAARAIIGANIIWVALSIGLLRSGWIAPTLAGQVFVIGQALAVALFAGLQTVGLLQSRAASA